MREVSVYYAYDDTEFFDKDECLAYEKEALDMLQKIDECYSFYDKFENLFLLPQTDDIEDWMDFMGVAGNECDYIKVFKTLPDSAAKFINDQWGFCILPEDFNNRTGYFKYNYFTNVWEKVGE